MNPMASSPTRIPSPFTSTPKLIHPPSPGGARGLPRAGVLCGWTIERPEIEVAHDVRVGKECVMTIHVVGRERADDQALGRERIDELHRSSSGSQSGGNTRFAASSTTIVKNRLMLRTEPL